MRGWSSALTRPSMVCVLLGLLTGCGDESNASIAPAEAVDAFHRSLASGETALALSLLAKDVIVFEQGDFDRSREAYTMSHLEVDMKFAQAVQRRVIERRSTGDGNIHWVLTRYHLTGEHLGAPIDHERNETMILRKNGDHWHVSHIHWSTRAR